MDNLTEDYLNYDPDKDYNGARGMEIAERTFERYGSDFNKIKLEMNLQRLERTLKSVK